MEKRTYKKVMDVPTEMLVTEPVLVDKIKDRVKEEVINGIVGLMSNGNEYIVSLSDIIETQNYSCDFMSRFEQKINLVPLVRCKDCKHFYRDDIEEHTPYGFYNTCFHAFCDKHWDKEQGEYIDVDTDDFCAWAERREDE